MKWVSIVFLLVSVQVFAQQQVVKLLPKNSSLTDLGADYITLADGNSWSGYFTFPGYTSDYVRYNGN